MMCLQGNRKRKEPQAAACGICNCYLECYSMFSPVSRPMTSSTGSERMMP